jgi:hypothetical protein
MRIVEIESLKEKELDLFFDLPKIIYKNNLTWAPETREDIERDFTFSSNEKSQYIRPIVAISDKEKPLARAVVFSDSKAFDQKRRKIGNIAYFEALENEHEAVKAVFRSCERILSGLGVNIILTPKYENLIQGLLVKGFEQPHTFLTTYNPPYYYNYFKENGYKDFKQLFGVNLTEETYKGKNAYLEKIRIRTFNPEEIERETKIYHYLNNTIFQNTYDFIPRTYAESEKVVQSFLQFMDEELIILAENLEGKPVGFLICFPDINQYKKEGKIDRARVISVGVLEEYRRKRIGNAMGTLLLNNLLKKGYTSAEGSIVLSTNRIITKGVRGLGLRPDREFVLFRKKLQRRRRRNL